MRLSAFILAILVLVLSCVPCKDTSFASKGDYAKHLTKTAPDDDAHDDSCSPFCHCSCCASVSIQHQVTALQEPLPSFAVLHTPRYVASIREVSIPVWQPPKLG